jgi:hypothetical protein
MNKFVALAMIILSATAGAAETVFRDIQLPGGRGKLINATLEFSDQSKTIAVRVANGQLITIPYDAVEKLSYEYTKKHRIKQGIVLAVISPWSAGGIIAFTKSTSHWLDIEFRDQGVEKIVVIHLDKHDYQQVCQAAKEHIGKEVELLGQAKIKTVTGKSIPQ